MLQTIRDKFSGVIALFIIGAIAITLVISFSGSNSGIAAGTYAAEVNGDEIPAVLYQRAVQNRLIRQQEAMQGEMTPELQEQIQRDVLEGLIRDEVVKQFVSAAGFRIDDEQLMQRIRSQDAFRVGGEYSYEGYVTILESQGMSPERYEREVRAGMEVTQLENGIVASAFFTPAEFRRYIELLAEERTVAALLLDPAQMSAEVALTPEQLQAYYELNNERFMTDEFVSIEYVEVLLEEVKAAVEVSDDDVRAFYDSNAERYIADDQRNVSHILFLIGGDMDDATALAAATEVEARLEQGESFEALAGELSQDPVSAAVGGDLGWAAPGDYPEAFEAALFELEPGQVSPPIRTEFGFHLIRLDELREGAQQSFGEVREELFEELRTQRAMDGFYALAEHVDDLALENSGSLSTVAEQAGLELLSIERFGRDGAEPLGFSPALVEAAYSVAVMEDGENSPLIELADDRAVVLSVVEHQSAAVRPFADVQELVEEAMRSEGAAEVARMRGEQILARLENGESFDDLATEFEFEVPSVVTLDRATPDMTPEALAEIFRVAAPGDGQTAYHGRSLADGGYVVFRVDAVTAGRPDSIPQQQRDQRKLILAQQSGGNAAGALVADLRSEARVLIAPNLFDQSDQL